MNNQKRETANTENRPVATAESLPVINYHGLEASAGEYSWLEEEIPYVTSTENFNAQLEKASRSGFYTLLPEDLEAWQKGLKPGKVFLLTFDDGMKSHYDYALPALKKRGFKAVFFVPAGLIGKKGQMTWEDLKTLRREGFEIGSHGMQHIPLIDLVEKELRNEFQASKQILEDGLGAPVKSFSIPRGYYEPRHRVEAEKAGYRYLFTSSFGLNARRGMDFLCLRRMAVKRKTSLDEFRNCLEGRLGMRLNWEKAKERVRGSVPPAFYDALAFAKRRIRGC